MKTDQAIIMIYLAVALATIWSWGGYWVAYNQQEARIQACGQGWYEQLQLTAELMPYYEEATK